MRYLLTLCSLFLASSAFAGKALMENIPSSANAIFVSTQPGAVYIKTVGSMTITGAGGLGVTNTITAGAFSGDGSGLTNLASAEGNTFASSKTFTNAASGILVKSSVTASAFFGDGSNLTGISTTDFGPSTGALRTDLYAVGASTKATNEAVAAEVALALAKFYEVGASTKATNEAVAGKQATLTAGSVGNELLANAAVANLSGTNTGDQTTITGNAGTATALAANGANCSAGSYPLGVDSAGAAESCTVAPTGEENTYGDNGGTKTFKSLVGGTSFYASTGYYWPGGTMTSTMTKVTGGKVYISNGSVGSAFTAPSATVLIEGATGEGSADLLEFRKSNGYGGTFFSQYYLGSGVNGMAIGGSPVNSRWGITGDWVNRRVGISTGVPAYTLDVNGNAGFGNNGTKSIFDTAGSLGLASNSDLTLSGPTAYATFPASATASAFYGWGGSLAGIPSTSSIVGVYLPVAGNAATASALASDPTDCGANEYATAIAANGNLTCSIPPAGAGETNTYTSTKTFLADVLAKSSVTASGFFGNGSAITSLTGANVVGNITGNAGTATALAANPADCAANQFANTIAASGALSCAAIADADVPNNITVDLAATATALAANGANCSAGYYPLGVDASGAVESCTLAASGGGETNTYGVGGATKTFVSNVHVSSSVSIAGTLDAAQANITSMTVLAGATLYFDAGSYTVGLTTQSYATMSAGASLANTSSLVTCFSGSTVTVTLAANKSCLVTFSGTGEFSGSASGFKLGILVNSAVPSGYTATYGIIGERNLSSAYQPENVGFSVPITLSSGSNSLCLTGAAGGSSTVYLGTTSSAVENYPRFGVTCFP